MQLEGNVAVVTGAARGMGRGIAAAFAANGMRVVLADVDPEPLAEAQAEVEAAGVEALAVPTDVSSLEQVQALAGATLDRFGAVHVVCSNAGVAPFGAVGETSMDDWRWTLSVNLWGPIHGIQVFLPIMQEQGAGHLSATASESGLYAVPFLAAYNVSKFGVVGLMASLERDLRAQGSVVRASVLCPGAVATDIMHSDRDRSVQSRAARRDSDATAAFEHMVGEAVAHGMDPAEVGARVVDAVRHDRFWIFTHDHVPATALRQAEAMAADGTLIDLG